MSILNKIFGDANERVIKSLQIKVKEINQLEKKFERFSVADFKKQTKKWQAELHNKAFEEQQKHTLIID